VAQTQTHHKGDEDGAHHGIGRYIAVWAALIAGTIVTVWTGRMDLGAANIWVAMLIASVKASLVVLFFMHLWESNGVNRMVFVVSVVFVAVLILGVFGDLLTRQGITLPNGGPMPASAASADHGGEPPAAGAHAPAPAAH
jgi:cytochrome c oxidase subunit IV